MSLLKCKECGTSISEQAEICPKCGVPGPTNIFTAEKPKCSEDGCYNFLWRGTMCQKHYDKDINLSSMLWFGGIVIFLIIIFNYVKKCVLCVCKTNLNTNQHYK